MPLRRKGNATMFPAAAEVLEVRSLLSAGSAVHQAEHFAAQQVAPAKLQQVAVTALVNINGTPSSSSPATSFAISPISLTPGSVVKAHASFTVVFQNIQPVTFTGSFSAKVISSGPFLSGTKVELNPTGGTFVAHFTENGHKMKELLVPLGIVGEVVLDAQQQFTGLAVAYTLKQGPPGSDFGFGFKT
jgi:hypothetical protein